MQTHAEFLQGLLFEAGKYFHISYIVDTSGGNRTRYACLPISYALAKVSDKLTESFKQESIDVFDEHMTSAYLEGTDVYNSIVGNSERETFSDEVEIFHDRKFNRFHIKLTDNTELVGQLNNVASDKSHAIIIRDSNAFFVVYHESGNFLIIDPHIQYCGLLPINYLVRYITYDNVWKNNIYIIRVEQNIATAQAIASATAPATATVTMVPAIASATVPATATMTEPLTETGIENIMELMTIAENLADELLHESSYLHVDNLHIEVDADMNTNQIATPIETVEQTESATPLLDITNSE